jgi:hypothetical protein
MNKNVLSHYKTTPEKLFNEILNQLIQRKKELTEYSNNSNEKDLNHHLLSFHEGLFYGFLSGLAHAKKYSTIILEGQRLKDKDMIEYFQPELNPKHSIKVLFNINKKDQKILMDFAFYLITGNNKEIYENFFKDYSEVNKQLLININKFMTLIK